jgi:hypothetical protein
MFVQGLSCVLIEVLRCWLFRLLQDLGFFIGAWRGARSSRQRPVRRLRTVVLVDGCAFQFGPYFLCCIFFSSRDLVVIGGCTVLVI